MDGRRRHSAVLILVLPLSSGELCLYKPLTVSDVFGDNVFEILSDFRVQTHFFLLRTNLHVLAANKKSSQAENGHILTTFHWRGVGALHIKKHH